MLKFALPTTSDPMPSSLKEHISKALGSPVLSVKPLVGGCVSNAFNIQLSSGIRCVAKTMSGTVDLRVEGRMLQYLKDHSKLPVPEVYHATKSLLILEYLRNDTLLSNSAQIDAARYIARLHDITQSHFGFESKTLIGPLNQPNPLSSHWVTFFRDHRLLYMTQLAEDAGQLPTAIAKRIWALADKLDRYLIEPDQPSLIHGDLWAGNVLCFGKAISGFIDPAIYFANAEIELAYATLFSTFGEPFFKTYQEHRSIKPSFFEERCDLYNLYPLLVHVRLFGGHYVSSLDSTLKRFGF